MISPVIDDSNPYARPPHLGFASPYLRIICVGAVQCGRNDVAAGAVQPAGPDADGAATPAAAAALLAAAGLYQLTPLKRACLRICRSPLSYLLQHWRSGTFGAVRLGYCHGLYCLGCCWALTLLLFAGGVIDLVVIVALTPWVLAEKLAPLGERTARASGLALLAMAVWAAIY